MTLQLFAPPGAEDDTLVEWQAEVGFFRVWEPPWSVLLGQVGFFDQFTVTLHRQAQALAIERGEVFDDRYGVLIQQADERRRRERD